MASSSGGLSRRQSLSSAGKLSAHKPSPPPTTLTPENSDAPFEPCAATAGFLLYAQRNRILVVHHHSLAIERRFDLHREDVLWITADNFSERGSGRLAVSYDAGKTAIVWDILSGAAVSRFSAYEHIKVASFMRNGNIAFGNDQGNIILFEPATSEHISARTIFDPITAIAPSADCQTFAIGYLNGSILIATLQPFTILHTLTTTRAPSRITGLSWHGSSSKQKTDMLATQTLDGDLRVWSVPKAPLHEPPTVIRVLQRAEYPYPTPCWCAWSKNGRIVQYADGETRAWDVRTKKVSWETVPTVDGVVGITNHGPSGTMFTLSRDYGVQQYDLNPAGRPVLVASAKHPPANTPPTPPVMPDERKDLLTSRSMDETISLHTASDTGDSSADEGAPRSPMQRIAMELDSLDALQEELRDKVMPLSPHSSRSSVSSRSSGGRRLNRRYLYDRPDSSRAASTTGGATEFSLPTPSFRPAHDSISIRSTSSMHSNSKYRASNLRNPVLRSPEESKSTTGLDLFPHVRARSRDVPFRTPHYGNVARTPELLQREMLSVLFGWNDTARSLIRDEMQRHKPGSTAAVLLAKWLGDTVAEQIPSMFGGEGMTSTDWMMLAINAIGADTQKQVGEAFVQRLLEKGDVHPAAGILLGLGEHDDAIEIYVAQNYWLEAVLLTCLTCPSDWQRISYMIRKWGETAVQSGQAELAVRCFSCTSIETSEPWFSPRAQDAAYTAQQERLMGPSSAGAPLTSPPLSPPSRSNSQRLAQMNGSLKLITTFGDRGAPVNDTMDVPTPVNAMGVTPIAQSALPDSALSARGQETWRARGYRDPSSARTATPSGYGKKRLPSRSDIERAKLDTANMATPVTAARDIPPPLPLGTSRRTPSLSSLGTNDSSVNLQPTVYIDRNNSSSATHLPSPSPGAFNRFRAESRGRRNASQERKPDGLQVQILETRYAPSVTPGLSTGTSAATYSSKIEAASPATTTQSGKARSIDEYLAGVEEAREEARERRAQSKQRERSRKRDASKGARGTSRVREPSEDPGRNVRYIVPGKRSPSSPIPMSPEEIALAAQANKAKPEPATSEDESFYKVASPIEPPKDLRPFNLEPWQGQATEIMEEQTLSPTVFVDQPTKSPAAFVQTADNGRGRPSLREPGSNARSPSSPLPMPIESQATQEREETNSDGRRVRLRSGSQASESARSRRAQSSDRRERSSSRKPMPIEDVPSMPVSTVSKVSMPDSSVVGSTLSGTTDNSITFRPRGLTKELAQRELEERRLSLARRPSAPSIPLPGEAQNLAMRPGMMPRAPAENSPTRPLLVRAATVDPDQMSKYGKNTNSSTHPAPIGLPSTPRAMRHPKYMGSDTERENTPPVPEVPENASNLSSIGSSLSQVSHYHLGSTAPSYLTSNLTSNMTYNESYLTSNVSNDDSVSALSSQVSSNPQIYDEEDTVAPLLPSSVYGQKGMFRAASAPPEKTGPNVHPAYKPNLPQSSRRPSNARKISPPESQMDKANTLSIDEALASTEDPEILIINNDDPPVLPELQHLADPPPPPPPPKQYTMPLNIGSGMISIAIDENAPTSAIDVPTTLPSMAYSGERSTPGWPIDRNATASPTERAMTASPAAHRRGRGSVTDAFGSRFRDFGERMRSTSRNRTKSSTDYKATSPYETVLPPMPLQHQRRESEQRSKSPYEQAMAAQNFGEMLPPPPPPPPPPASTGPDGRLQETSIPPSNMPRSSSALGGYRSPKDIRANMPPDSLQQGVYPGSSTYL